MADFQRRKKVRRILYSPLSIIALSMVALFLAKGVWTIWQKERIATSEAKAAALNRSEVEAREHALSASLDALQSERGKEAAIREKFGATKPGEGVIVIVDPERPTTSAATTTSWWQKLLSFF
jgi:cell division protein FtsB